MLEIKTNSYNGKSDIELKTEGSVEDVMHELSGVTAALLESISDKFQISTSELLLNFTYMVIDKFE